jgi:hypothetical protein
MPISKPSWIRLTTGVDARPVNGLPRLGVGVPVDSGALAADPDCLGVLVCREATDMVKPV